MKPRTGAKTRQTPPEDKQTTGENTKKSLKTIEKSSKNPQKQSNQSQRAFVEIPLRERSQKVPEIRSSESASPDLDTPRRALEPPRPEKEPPSPPEKVLTKGKPGRTLPKVTVEEVEDSGEGNSPINPVEELPFRNVPPIERVEASEVLPRKPEGPKKTAEKRAEGSKAYRVTPNVDVEAATKRVVSDIENTTVQVTVGDLLATSNGIQRGIAAKMGKSRRSNFIQNIEDDVLANDVQNFSATMVPVLGGPKTKPLAARNLNVPNRAAQYMSLPVDAISINDLEFDEAPWVMNQAVAHMPEGAYVLEDPVTQYLDSLAPGELPRIIYASLPSAHLRCARLTLPTYKRGTRKVLQKDKPLKESADGESEKPSPDQDF
ncbi:hypothetical protein C8R47DRAFT_1082450 [Mycena vitilis]|nr:hypothetical protein C8R47DRAFT_1082450 [Mycena vitilis]